jgi:RimJ/RimL family protein N-acetyltransferase
MEHRVASSKNVTSPSCSDRQNARLAVRPLAIDDLDAIVAYFTKLSQADANRMGLELNRVPSATQLRSELNKMIATPRDCPSTFVLAWCVDGETIGHSSLKDIVPGEVGSTHLHMWRTDLRGKGYGPRLFCLSALKFYDRFNLKRIICEPKADNPMANGMLKKVGFPLILTHIAASSELSAVCELNRYAIVRDVAERYLRRHTDEGRNARKNGQGA